MKKYLILLTIPILFFFIGCDSEDSQLDSQLDSELFGTWCYSAEKTNYNVCLSFSSNGILQVFYFYDLEGGTTTAPEQIPSNPFEWWTQDGYLFTDVLNPILYNVSGNNLSINITHDYIMDGNYILQ